MTSRSLLLLFIAFCFTLLASARGVESLVQRLQRLDNWGAEVEYVVTMPQGDEATYQLTLTALAGQGKFARYDGGWTASLPQGILAWRNHRLLHPSKAQFANLFPDSIASQLIEMQSDTARYHLRIEQHTIDATRLIDSQVEALFHWQFDPATGSPLLFTAEYNPGAITAQQIRASYAPQAPEMETLNEATLRLTFPEAFERTVTRLPSFSLPIVGSPERLTYQEGDNMPAPTILVMLGNLAELTPEVQSKAQTLAAKHNAQIIWALLHRLSDEEAEDTAPADTMLHGCRSLARDCCISNFPTLLICKPSGEITETITLQ